MKIKFEKVRVGNRYVNKIKGINYKVAAIGAGAIMLLSLPVILMSGNKVEEKEKPVVEIAEGELDAIIQAGDILESTRNICSPNWMIENAKIAFANNDIDEGEKLLGNARKFAFLDSKDANEIILTYFFNGYSLESIEFGEEFIQKFKDDITMHKTMIMVYLYNGVKAEATKIISELNERVSLNLKLLEPTEEYRGLTDEQISMKFADLAEMYYLIGDKKETMINMERAWEHNKDNYKIYDLLSKMGQDDMTGTLKEISYRDETASEQFKNGKIASYNEKMFKLWIAKIYSMYSNTAQQGEFILEGLEEEFGQLVNYRRLKISTLFLTGKVEEAVKIMDELMKEKPDDFTVRYTAATIYYLTENFDKALEEALITQKFNPNYEDTYAILLPNIYNGLGEEEKVEKLFRQSLEKNPVSVSNINAIAEYYFNNGNYEKSIYYYDIAKALSPYNSEIRYKAAWTNIGLARSFESEYIGKEMPEEVANQVQAFYRDALRSVQRSIELTKEEPIAKYYRMVSILYMNLGESKLAYKYIREAYSLDEDDILTLNNAGVFHILMNDAIDEKENDDRIQRGYYNLFKANEGLTGDYNEEVIEIITKNYEIAKEFKNKFREADDNAVLELPTGFRLLY